MGFYAMVAGCAFFVILLFAGGGDYESTTTNSPSSSETKVLSENKVLSDNELFSRNQINTSLGDLTVNNCYGDYSCSTIITTTDISTLNEQVEVVGDRNYIDGQRECYSAAEKRFGPEFCEGE